ncbi:MAG: hypothetical protein EBU90_12410 [Proteobacteria bacterium]|nr:hypothetical protein [Pseudomonadota bacterium]
MITSFGKNDRDHILIFQDFLLKSLNAQNATFDEKMCTHRLGKNLSSFICEKNGKKLLVILDADDGCGGTPSDCKIIWSTLVDIQRTYRPDDMMILKSQVNSDQEYNQFYPFKEDIYPIGIFSNDPRRIFEVKNKWVEKPKDIDVFFAGGFKHTNKRPYAWPKNRDIRKWQCGAATRGYEKLLEIRSRRPDIKFALFDDVLSSQQFYDLLNRSKICPDLPGSMSSRKFYECLVLGKCVVSVKQQLTSWPCEEDIHYASLGEDLDFERLESKIDYLLENDNYKKIEMNVKKITEELTLEALVKKAKNAIETKINNIDKCVIQY